MSAETIALGSLGPDQCPSCQRNHTCVRSASTVSVDSADSPIAQSTLRQARQVTHQVPTEVPIYEIDSGETSRACVRRVLIITIIVLSICILLVIILRAIF